MRPLDSPIRRWSSWQHCSNDWEVYVGKSHQNHGDDAGNAHFFKKETCVRFMEIRDTRYSSDEIDHMPAAERNKTVFKWFVILRHPEAEKELHGTFTIPGITKKLEKLKAEQNEF